MITTEHAGGWTPERIDLLKKLWQEGKSAGQCAAYLGEGLTRSAVIGKVHRLKLAKRGQTSHPKPKPVPRLKSNNHGGLAFKISQARKDGLEGTDAMEAVLGKRTAPIVEEIEEGIDVTHLLGVMQVSDRTCRYPHGDPLLPNFGFCARTPKPSSVYCPEHHARCYVRV